MSTDDLQSKIKAAAEIAKGVPKNLQEAAFNRALDELLKTGSQRSAAADAASTRPQKPKSTPKKSQDGSGADRLLAEIDRTNHPEIFDAPRILEKSMLVLRVAHDSYGVDGLSARRIADVLKKKFRIKATRQGVTAALDGAGKWVDRRKVGRSVSYHVMAAGERYLDGEEWKRESDSSGPKAPANKRRRAKKNRGSSSKSAQPKATAPAKRKSAPKKTSTNADGKRRPARRTNGPAAVLRELIRDGYFKKSRTISDIQTHMKKKKARSFKVNELSTPLARLVRSDELDRDTNADGQFEYTAK